jgi:ABC-2 type transport system permease protein
MNWLGLHTLLTREIKRFAKVSAQTIVAPLIMTVLYIAAFALALGDRPSPLGTGRYIDFLAPGLIMMAIINNAFQNASSSLIIAKIQGNAVDFLMPPLSAAELTIAFIGGAAARGILVGVVSALVIVPFANITPAHVWAVAFFTVAASVIFGAIGLIGGVWADKFDHLAAITNFVVTPLVFLSGTFYSVDVLPEPFSTFAHNNPVFFLIDGFRYGFIGAADGAVAISFWVSLILAVGLSYASWALIKSGWRLKA